MTRAEQLRARLLLAVVDAGILAPLAPFAADMKRTAILIAADDGLAAVRGRLELGAAVERGRICRTVTPHGAVEVAIVDRTLVEGAADELTREVAGPVAFGEVRVVVLGAGGWSFGSVAIAPSTRGVLA